MKLRQHVFTNKFMEKTSLLGIVGATNDQHQIRVSLMVCMVCACVHACVINCFK